MYVEIFTIYIIIFPVLNVIMWRHTWQVFSNIRVTPLILTLWLSLIKGKMSNGEHSPKFTQQVSLEHQRWLAERFISGQLSTKIYDKRDDFNFKIVDFPNICGNIPASPADGVYISQLIRYARASTNYSDFLNRHLHLRNRLLDQGYEKIRLIRSLKKFIFRYQDLVEIYSVSAETIINDAFSYSENV